MIIVEGPDNSGKTTLIDALCEAFPKLHRIKSCGPDTNYGWWMSVLKGFDPETHSKLISDRFFYSEFVYGPLVRGTTRLSKQQAEVIYSLLVTMQPLVVRCHLIRDETLFNSRPQHFDWDVALAAEIKYGEVLNQPGILHYYPEATELVQVAERVDQYLKQMVAWEKKRTVLIYGRGQMNSPWLMIVGQQFSRDNKWLVPFERSQSGRMIHKALRIAGFMQDQIWFTNAFKREQTILSNDNISSLTSEIDLVQPQKVVALGNKAAGLTSIVTGASMVKLIHPGYFVRKGEREKGETYFIEKFQQIREGSL